VKNFEIKRIFDKRLPFISEDAFQVLEKMGDTHNVVALSPGLFDRPMGNWLFAWDAGWKLDMALHQCNRVGAKVLVVFGVKKTGKESFQQVVDHFGNVAERAAKAGVTVAVEPHKGNWIETAETGAEIFKAVNSPSFGLNWDVSNCRGPGEEPADGYAHALPWIKHMHLKDGTRKEGGGSKGAPLGEGDIGWADLFKKLAADKVDVAFSIETHVKPGYENTRTSVANAKEMMTAAGLAL
jgi:sugar phosphate isomerase/epimerase